KQQVSINGQPVTLIDTLGMCGNDDDDDDDDETGFNSKKLDEVLRENFRFKLFFVLNGHSRIIFSDDLALISRVNQAIRDTKGVNVEFRVIVNQIHRDKEYQEYKQNLTQDSFQKYFDHFKESSNLSLDIVTKDIILLRYDESAVRNRGFYNQLASVIAQRPIGVNATVPTVVVIQDEPYGSYFGRPTTSSSTCVQPPSVAVGSVVTASAAPVAAA
ncbi:hypothetical protein BGW38_004104, partial [Lunasporangiospora selenospora]